MTCGIYKIENLKNNKIYVGKSKVIEDRFNSHMILLDKGNHYNVHLQGSWNKYGSEFFNFAILYEVGEENLDVAEICSIFLFESNNPNRGYNLTSGGEGVQYNSLPDNIKDRRNQKISKALKGRKIPNRTTKGMLGKKHSKATRDKMSKSLKGRRAWNKGLTKHTDERVMRNYA